MLAQPFIENAIEHGFPKKITDGQIKIHFSLQQDHILIAVQDNGIGMEEAERTKTDVMKKHKSLANEITAERLYLLNKGKRKKITFKMDDLNTLSKGKETGTKISFLIPFRDI
jgi:sensor histidine kinase YesM